LDKQPRFSPNSASLKGSESGGGHFPRQVLRLLQTRNSRNVTKRGRKGRTMHPLIQLKQKTSLFLIALLLACFGLLPRAQAVVPAPDGGFPGGNTAEGQAALLSLT